MGFINNYIKGIGTCEFKYKTTTMAFLSLLLLVSLRQGITPSLKLSCLTGAVLITALMGILKK